jgi:hypothetical protein
MEPAPGPNTLRMGEPPSGVDGTRAVENPLQIYRQHVPAPEPAALPAGGAESH